eukprot:scaffold78183_cov15-Tisochrysis_lutea.AAC.1
MVRAWDQEDGGSRWAKQTVREGGRLLPPRGSLSFSSEEERISGEKAEKRAGGKRCCDGFIKGVVDA